jgi:hypothetical protein
MGLYAMLRRNPFALQAAISRSADYPHIFSS